MSLEMARTPFNPKTAPTERLRARLSRQMLETVVRHSLIEDGDKFWLPSPVARTVTRCSI